MATIVVPVEGRPTDPPGAEALVGINGNAFAVMGETRRLLRKHGASNAFLEAYVKEATSGDYDHLLAASVQYLEAE